MLLQLADKEELSSHLAMTGCVHIASGATPKMEGINRRFEDQIDHSNNTIKLSSVCSLKFANFLY